MVYAYTNKSITSTAILFFHINNVVNNLNLEVIYVYTETMN